MMFIKGDRLTWQGRTGTVINIHDNRSNSHGYVRLLLDDVHLPYWVEYNRLGYAPRDYVRAKAT